MLSLGSVDNFLWNYWNSYSVRPGFLSCFLASNLFDLPSLKLAVPLWKGTSSKGTDGLPTMIFQDRLLLVFGRVDVGTAGKLNKQHDFLKVIPGLCVFLVTVFVTKKTLSNVGQQTKPLHGNPAEKSRFKTITNGRGSNRVFFGGPKLIPLNIQPYIVCPFLKAIHPRTTQLSCLTRRDRNTNECRSWKSMVGRCISYWNSALLKRGTFNSFQGCSSW